MGQDAIDSGHSLGDFLHTVWETGKKITSFIVEKIGNTFRFVIKIGKQVFNWVIDAIRQIGGFIQKIFESIKVFFEDLFEFLAFLFNWDDIIATKNAYKGFANNALTSLSNEIGNIKQFVDEQLNAEIAKFSPELVDMPTKMKEMGVSDEDSKTAADPRTSWLSSKQDFINNGKEGSLIEQIPDELGQTIQKAFLKLTPIIEELGQGFIVEIAVISDFFKLVIKGEKSFGEFMYFMSQKLAGFSLFLVKQLLDIVLQTLESLIALAQASLNQKWNIPVISPLYKKVSGGSDLSFLDLSCLLVAIPATVLYKIVTKKAPFGNEQVKQTFIASGNTVFQLNLNSIS